MTCVNLSPAVSHDLNLLKSRLPNATTNAISLKNESAMNSTTELRHFDNFEH